MPLIADYACRPLGRAQGDTCYKATLSAIPLKGLKDLCLYSASFYDDIVLRLDLGSLPALQSLQVGNRWRPNQHAHRRYHPSQTGSQIVKVGKETLCIGHDTNVA